MTAMRRAPHRELVTASADMQGAQGAHKGVCVWGAVASTALGEQVTLPTLTVTTNIMLLLRVSHTKPKNPS